MGWKNKNHNLCHVYIDERPFSGKHEMPMPTEVLKDTTIDRTASSLQVSDSWHSSSGQIKTHAYKWILSTQEISNVIFSGPQRSISTQ